MSVILDALRSHRKPAAQATPSTTGDHGEIHWGTGKAPQSSRRISKSSIILFVALILALAFAGYHIFFHSTPEEILKPIAIPKPAAPSPETIAANQLNQANNLMASEKWDEALVIYLQILPQYAQNAQIFSNIGLIYLKKKQYSESESYFKKSINYNPTCAECFNNLGYLNTLQNKVLDAESNLLKATMLRADYPDPYFNLAVLYERNGDLKNAIESYRNFLKTSRDKTSTLYSRVQDHLNSLVEDK